MKKWFVKYRDGKIVYLEKDELLYQSLETLTDFLLKKKNQLIMYRFDD